MWLNKKMNIGAATYVFDDGANVFTFVQEISKLRIFTNFNWGFIMVQENANA